MNKLLLCVLLGLGLIAASNAEAIVYKCVTQEGAIIYQDVRCATAHPDNKALPIKVNKRLRNCPNEYATVTALMKKKEQAAMRIARQQQQVLKKKCNPSKLRPKDRQLGRPIVVNMPNCKKQKLKPYFVMVIVPHKNVT
jgi:hypothetical protein